MTEFTALCGRFRASTFMVNNCAAVPGVGWLSSQGWLPDFADDDMVCMAVA